LTPAAAERIRLDAAAEQATKPAEGEAVHGRLVLHPQSDRRTICPGQFSYGAGRTDGAQAIDVPRGWAATYRGRGKMSVFDIFVVILALIGLWIGFDITDRFVMSVFRKIRRER
jgi:hypothetical protein